MPRLPLAGAIQQPMRLSPTLPPCRRSVASLRCSRWSATPFNGILPNYGINVDEAAANGATEESCEERLSGKCVGDFFDSFLKSVTDDGKSMIPTNAQELSRWTDRASFLMQGWTDRVIFLMPAFAKKGQSVTVGGNQVLLKHALEVPEEFNVVQICEAVEIDRPRVALAVDNCRPNYASWASMKETLRTFSVDHGWFRFPGLGLFRIFGSS